MMKLKNLKGKRSRKQLSRQSTPENPAKGFLRHKIGEKKEETVPQRIQDLNKPEFSGIVSFLHVRD